MDAFAPVDPTASFVGSARRYLLLKYQVASARFEFGLALAWLGKHDASDGTALPADFPSRETLAAAHYTTREDLTGASVDELATQAGLTRGDAQRVLAALAALP